MIIKLTRIAKICLNVEIVFFVLEKPLACESIHIQLARFCGEQAIVAESELLDLRKLALESARSLCL